MNQLNSTLVLLTADKVKSMELKVGLPRFTTKIQIQKIMASGMNGDPHDRIRQF